MEINIPISWDDVTVNQYQALAQLDSESCSKLKYSIHLVQILCDITDVSNFPLEIINEIVLNFGFLKEPIPSDKRLSINFKGEEYKWVGSFNELTVGEMLSIEQIIDLEELSYNMSYDVVCAILLRKDGEEFNASNFNENRERFGELPISYIMGMIVFFLNGGRLSMENIKAYSLIKMSMNTQRRRWRWRGLLRKLMQHLKISNG